MGKTRKIRKVLKEKYDLSADDQAQFAWFPSQKGKPFEKNKPLDSLTRHPSQFNKTVEEVKSILRSFKPEHILSQSAVKDLFKQKCWEIEYKFFRKEGLWSFDAYKDRVAVEVLGKNVDEVFKDCWKFLLAFWAKRIDVGVLVVPHRRNSSKYPDAISVDSILDRFDPVLKDDRLWILRASYFVHFSK